MAKFVTIGYGDRKGYDRTDPAVPDAAHAHDARLAERGGDMGRPAHQCRCATTTAPGSRPRPGRSCSPPCPRAGFGVIEAATLEEAVTLAAQTPCAVAQGVVEVWPLER